MFGIEQGDDLFVINPMLLIGTGEVEK